MRFININRRKNKVSLFWEYGVKYADDFVLIGRTLPVEITDSLKGLLDWTGKMINELKTRQIDTKRKASIFLNSQNVKIWI